MTPDEEAEFIALWQQGLTCPAIAQRLDIPPGTARSRAYHLQQRGLITARPKGGTRRRQGTVHASVQSSAEMHGAQSVQSSAVHAPVHGAVQVQNSAEPPIPAALAMEFGRLWAAIDALQRDVHRPVHDIVQSLPRAPLRRPRRQYHRALEPLPQTRAAGAHRGAGPGARDCPEPCRTGAVMDRVDRPSIIDALTEAYRRRA
jgi:hypothetical protein